MPGTEAAGPSLSETVAYLHEGNICWKPFKRDSSLTADLASVSASYLRSRRKGAFGKGPRSAGAQPTFPPYWIMGAKLAGVEMWLLMQRAEQVRLGDSDS